MNNRKLRCIVLGAPGSDTISINIQNHTKLKIYYAYPDGVIHTCRESLNRDVQRGFATQNPHIKITYLKTTCYYDIHSVETYEYRETTIELESLHGNRYAYIPELSLMLALDQTRITSNHVKFDSVIDYKYRQFEHVLKTQIAPFRLPNTGNINDPILYYAFGNLRDRCNINLAHEKIMIIYTDCDDRQIKDKDIHISEISSPNIFTMDIGGETLYLSLDESALIARLHKDKTQVYLTDPGIKQHLELLKTEHSSVVERIEQDAKTKLGSIENQCIDLKKKCDKLTDTVATTQRELRDEQYRHKCLQESYDRLQAREADANKYAAEERKQQSEKRSQQADAISDNTKLAIGLIGLGVALLGAYVKFKTSKISSVITTGNILYQTTKFVGSSICNIGESIYNWLF